MKLIQDFPKYSITEDGHVINIETNKVLKPLLNKVGYLQLGLYISGKQTRKYLHRLIAEAFIPNPENKPEVNHIDGNKQNNSISNLEWVTPSENRKHAYTIGLKVYTEKQRIAFSEIGKTSAIIRKWQHPQHGTFIGSAAELVRQFSEMKLKRSSLSNVALGKYKQHKDWTI